MLVVAAFSENRTALSASQAVADVAVVAWTAEAVGGDDTNGIVDFSSRNSVNRFMRRLVRVVFFVVNVSG
jgi:hypothetical protein